MSVFSSIVNKIFGRAQAAPKPGGNAPADATAPAAGGAQASPTAGGAAPAAPAASGAPASAAPAAQGTGAAAAAAPAQAVDVEAVLNEAAAKNPQQLNWRTSIVDLLKLLDLDSSLASRKELAKELNYTGDTNDSAAMNIWLHKQVMRKLAENGGKVPADLKD